MYNYKFVLGDPSCDGHGCTEEFHIQTSHSHSEILEAYNTFAKEHFDYLNVVGAEYECFCGIEEKYLEILINLNIIDKDDYRIIKYDESKEYISDYNRKWEYLYNGCLYFDDGLEDFINIFFDIIKFVITDFEWNHRDLEEQQLYLLDHTGYGLVRYP